MPPVDGDTHRLTPGVSIEIGLKLCAFQVGIILDTLLEGREAVGFRNSLHQAGLEPALSIIEVLPRFIETGGSGKITADKIFPRVRHIGAIGPVPAFTGPLPDGIGYSIRFFRHRMGMIPG